MNKKHICTLSFFVYHATNIPHLKQNGNKYVIKFKSINIIWDFSFGIHFLAKMPMVPKGFRKNNLGWALSKS